MTITDDKAFTLALASLPVERQRQIAGRVCRQVQKLSSDVRVKLSWGQPTEAQSRKPRRNTGFSKPACSVEENRP